MADVGSFGTPTTYTSRVFVSTFHDQKVKNRVEKTKEVPNIHRIKYLVTITQPFVF